MSLQYTYDTLTAAVLAYAEDSDPDFVANVDDFIAKGELRLLRDLELETFEQWLEVTISAGDRTLNKPADVVAVNDLWIRDPSAQQWIECPRRSFEYCLMFAPLESSTGVPAYYAEYDEDEIYVVPTPIKSYTGGNARVRATIRPSGLSASVSDTFLSEHYSDMLFHAVMMEAYEFQKNEAKVQSSAQKYQSLIPSVVKEVEEVVRKHYKGINNQKAGADS